MKNLRDKKLAEQILLEISENLPNNKDIELSIGYIYDINSECNYVIKAKIKDSDENLVLNIQIAPLAQELELDKSMDMLSNAVVEQIKEYEASRELLKSIDVYDYAKVKEFLSVRLINKKMNKLTMLEHPYKTIGDILEICYIKIPVKTKLSRNGYNWMWTIDSRHVEKRCTKAMEIEKARLRVLLIPLFLILCVLSY